MTPWYEPVACHRGPSSGEVRTVSDGGELSTPTFVGFWFVARSFKVLAESGISGAAPDCGSGGLDPG